MLVGLCGPLASGKNAVADILCSAYGFTRLYLRPPHHAYPSVSRDGVPRHSDRDGDADGERAATVAAAAAALTPDDRVFASVEALLAYVTPRWRDPFVLANVLEETTAAALRKRPFFLLIAVDAPLTLRAWAAFCARDDAVRFSGDVYRLMASADVHLINDRPTRAALAAKVRAIDVTNMERCRPSWDSYFMQLCDLLAHRSNCMKRRVGCVLVKDRNIVATGYNGTPRGITNCNEGGCRRCNEAAACGTGLDACMCLHAEENALLEAGRDRIVRGALGGGCHHGHHTILYCNTCPCLGCAKKIVQSGVQEVVFEQSYKTDAVTMALFQQAGIQVRRYTRLGHRY
ncbi:hypothetical protein CXG81DRAFT_8484 [Caulochytrium protostelioides]|uniref:Deoxycytidylate deaminase n=1 Tax=Caulochytrium protostelioides TaxID=1555241 RepID=A0A4V1ITM7_9FUNG|nr:hypothetical protein CAUPRSCDRAFT_6279 [Caulochytrium protostelioides]RKP04336.1 hypothetical protein CXG81DRAFT_8484 [Caulochytrium protostelioides]|eukprot:RKP04336.1 hypothetical protein CXG81DRAFT_8484 [Caulochytrium protostelioides]